MNRNDFLNMIGSRIPVNKSVLGEVYELIDLFPYFQSAHMLLLKGLKDNDDIKFGKQLRNSAVHIADREVLYYLLKNDKPSEPEQEKTIVEPVPDIEAISDLTTETQQTVIESARNSELLISEIEKDTGEPKSEEKDGNFSEGTGHSVFMAGSSENMESASVMLIVDENEQGEEEKIFFMDPGFSISEQEELLELDSDVKPYEPAAAGSEKGEVIIDEKSKESRRQLQTELIDKFIIANPRIEPGKVKSDQPQEDLSKPHIEERGGFVTETLARIYINQGYYSRAIDIYEKLSLKFPEKSSYFAAQIEKVKEYIKK